MYAQQLHDSIRVADRDGLVGWIVDLRGNSGGKHVSHDCRDWPCSWRGCRRLPPERFDTRSFGTPTCGLSTGNATYFLSDTSRLVITVSTMADRTQRAYGDAIAPDEVISNPDDAVSRAIQWLTFPGAITP